MQDPGAAAAVLGPSGRAKAVAKLATIMSVICILRAVGRLTRWLTEKSLFWLKY